MNDFLTYTIPMGVIILFAILTVMTITSLICLRFGKFSENVIFNLQVTMVGSVLSCGLVCIIILGGLYLDTQNHKYEITQTDNEVIITSDSPWIQNTHYPIIEHKNGDYYLEQRPNKTIKISDEKLSELMRK